MRLHKRTALVNGSAVHKFAARNSFQLTPFVPNYPFGVVKLDRPMPATQNDLHELKAVVRWLRGARNFTTRERVAADALERAIAYLEEPGARTSVVTYILSALHQSMRRVKNDSNIWVPVDRDLNDWALRQIEDMFGGPFQPEHKRGQPS